MAGGSGLRQELNEDRRRRFGSPGRTLALLCECGDDECHRTVLLSAEEYDARRPAPIVHAEHPHLAAAGGADAGDA